MNSKDSVLYENTLNGFMQEYGDSVLRTCYLLCGDLFRARVAAQKVFITAYNNIDSICASKDHSVYAALLCITMRQCPCPLLPHRYLMQTFPVSRMLSLSPSVRRVAVLCVYHSFSVCEAAWILGISEKHVRHRLNSAQIKLNK